MATSKAIDFTVNLHDLKNTQFVEKTIPKELSPNQVLLKIDKFSFTSNNITYGIVGEKMNYWKFFPTKSGYGILPAWGFANVMASNHLEVKVGQRFYGYYPMSSHLMVNINNISNRGFVDDSEHRQSLPPIYNYYTNTENDPGYHKESEALISIFRPLFITSFLIDEHIAENHFQNASQIVITSASSKTAQALAFLLAYRKKAHNLKINLIGLTSGKNKEFVQQLGWYDQTISYNEISQLNQDDKFIVIDFTGNHKTQFQLQTHLKENLLYNCLVGLVDWQNLKGEEELPSKGEFFFAPTHAQNRQKDWGQKIFLQKVGAAWMQFITSMQKVISINNFNGADRLETLYLDMLHGKIDPKAGNIVSLNH